MPGSGNFGFVAAVAVSLSMLGMQTKHFTSSHVLSQLAVLQYTRLAAGDDILPPSSRDRSIALAPVMRACSDSRHGKGCSIEIGCSHCSVKLANQDYELPPDQCWHGFYPRNNAG